jgi:hypothetical protein
VVSDHLATERRLQCFDEQLFEIEIPAGAEVRARRTWTGYPGASTSLREFGAEMRLETALSVSAVKIHYGDMHFERAGPEFG